MDDQSKTKILSTIYNILENKSKSRNPDPKSCQDTMDLFNLVKVIENYEELEPDIKEMLNEKARRDKWKIKRNGERGS